MTPYTRPPPPDIQVPQCSRDPAEPLVAPPPWPCTLIILNDCFLVSRPAPTCPLPTDTRVQRVASLVLSIADKFLFAGLPCVEHLRPLACCICHDCCHAPHLSQMCKFVIGHNADGVGLLEKLESMNKISELINVDDFT